MYFLGSPVVVGGAIETCGLLGLDQAVIETAAELDIAIRLLGDADGWVGLRAEIDLLELDGFRRDDQERNFSAPSPSTVAAGLWASSSFDNGDYVYLGATGLVTSDGNSSLSTLCESNLCGNAILDGAHERCDGSNDCTPTCQHVECAAAAMAIPDSDGFKVPGRNACWVRTRQAKRHDAALDDCTNVGVGWRLALPETADEKVVLDRILLGGTWMDYEDNDDASSDDLSTLTRSSPGDALDVDLLATFFDSDEPNSNNEDCIEAQRISCRSEEPCPLGSTPSWNDIGCDEARFVICEVDI
jgi:hypothetical protein